MTKQNLKNSGRRLLLSISFLIIALPLYAEISETKVEQATRQTDRMLQSQPIIEKLRKKPEGQPEIKIEEPQVAPEKKEAKFPVKKINLTGCESFSPEDFASITAKYENKELSMSGLTAIAKEIEGEYLRRGVIAAVLIPPQEIKDGTVNFQVVEARMGKLQIPDHKFYNKRRLAYYWEIPRGQILRYDKISKSIQIMNKNPDRQVKSALHAGKKPGTTDVALSVETQFPGHVTASYSNEGSTDTGKSINGIGIRHNNFLGLDDTLMTSYSYGRDFYGLNFFHNLPITKSGTTLVYGYSRSISIPTKETAASGIESKGKNSTVSLNQDLYNSKGEYFGETYLGFDAKDKVTYSNIGVYSKDRLRVFKLGGNFQQRGFGSVTYISPEVSQAVAAFGANKRKSLLASRYAPSTFTKFTLGIQHKRTLPWNLQGSFRAKGQVTSSKLAPQEQFSIGGMDSVRGYPAGDYSADGGVTTSAELLMPASFIPEAWHLPYAEAPLKDQTTFLTFVDYGYGMRRCPSPTDKKSATELGAGAGVRFALYNQAMLRLEWGWHLGANHAITQGGDSQFHFSVDVQDRLPQEIERIRNLIKEENIKKSVCRLLDAELGEGESPLRLKLAGLMLDAEQAYKEGRLEDAKALYEKVLETCESLKQQTEEYVKVCYEQEKELREENRRAREFFRYGEAEKAQAIWQKISKEAQPKELILKY